MLRRRHVPVFVGGRCDGRDVSVTEATVSAATDARSPAGTTSAKPRYRQPTFDEIGTPLAQVTFCVVDLETTGGSPVGGAGITEIGAVKVRHGEILGEFQTLVDPGEPVPPFISTLTGITDGMVFGQPRITSVLPAFLEFARGCVLVAHNAPFDVGFLNAAAAAAAGHQLARLRRRSTPRCSPAGCSTRDEVPNCKLSTLAPYFHASTTPDHRALDDARATVDVLHGLIERLGGSASTPSRSCARSPRGCPTRSDASGTLPTASPTSRACTSSSTRASACSTSARRATCGTGAVVLHRRRDPHPDRRDGRAGRRGHAHHPAATPLEAQVRELRLIHAHKPRYNRRSKFPERQVWLKVTVEPFPRLSMVKKVGDDGATYLGPFGSRRAAEQAATAMHEATRSASAAPKLLARTHGCRRVRSPRWVAASRRATATSASTSTRSRCSACARPSATPGRLVRSLLRRIRRLASGERFEEASRHRDRMAAFVQAAERTQRLRAGGGRRQIVAARRREEGGYDLHVMRYGRLAAAGFAPPGTDRCRSSPRCSPRPRRCRRPRPRRCRPGSIEEAEILPLARHARGPADHVEGELACPVGGAGSLEPGTAPGLRWPRHHRLLGDPATATPARPTRAPAAEVTTPVDHGGPQ